MRVPPIKIGVLGNDGYVNDVLRSYVKLLEAKPRSFILRMRLDSTRKHTEECWSHFRTDFASSLPMRAGMVERVYWLLQKIWSVGKHTKLISSICSKFSESRLSLLAIP